MRVILLCLLLAGCSSLGFLNPFSDPAVEVDTEIVAGDKKEEVNAQVGDSMEAEAITNINQIPFHYLLLFMLMSGWAIPSPGEMWRGFVRILPWSS